jgi:hypothetical protein
MLENKKKCCKLFIDLNVYGKRIHGSTYPTAYKIIIIIFIEHMIKYLLMGIGDNVT